MKIVANVSFSGRISMAKGEKREIEDENLLKDLMEAGYIREIAPAQKSDKNNSDSESEKYEKGDPDSESK